MCETGGKLHSQFSRSYPQGLKTASGINTLRTTQNRCLTSNKLDATGHTANGTRDEVRDAAAHERRERHQQEEAAPHARHHRADPPLQARDAVEGGVAPALLQHDGGLSLLVPHRVGAAPERTEGHGLVHLCPQQPVGHEEANAGGGGTQQGEQGPDHTRTCQTGRHGQQSHSHWTNSSYMSSRCVVGSSLWAFNTGKSSPSQWPRVPKRGKRNTQTEHWHRKSSVGTSCWLKGLNNHS